MQNLGGKQSVLWGIRKKRMKRQVINVNDVRCHHVAMKIKITDVVDKNFGFIKGVDNVNWPPYRDSKNQNFCSTISPPTQHHSFCRN